MSTPAYAELCATTRREGTALVTAGRVSTDAAVPTCGDWTVGRLLRHVGRVYHYAATVLTERATSDPGRPPSPGDADPVDYCEDALEEVVDALASTEPDAPVWNWSDRPATAAFWARRMALESAVHRWDAQSAHGYAQRLDPDLAVDGVDELLEVLVPREAPRRGGPGPVGTMLVEVAESPDPPWLVTLAPDGVSWERRRGPADVTARGSASDLLLVLYGRLPADRLTVDGDAGLLDRWAAHYRV